MDIYSDTSFQDAFSKSFYLSRGFCKCLRRFKYLEFYYRPKNFYDFDSNREQSQIKTVDTRYEFRINFDKMHCYYTNQANEQGLDFYRDSTDIYRRTLRPISS
jgi:hypothetical protein